MPALNVRPPAATVAPARAPRRRVWAADELRSHAMLVLTEHRIHLAPATGTPDPDPAAAAAAGADLGDLLGPLATVIDLAAVRRARLDLPGNSLTLEYAGAGARACRLTVVFADPDAADACFTKTWRRLGGGFTLQPYRQDFWALARGPLALLGAVLLATAVLAIGVCLLDDIAAHEGGSRGWSPGWRVVCGAGGAAAAAAQVWLYRRVTRPPVLLELTRN